MRALGVDGEHVHLGRQQRVLNLAQVTVDPAVAALSVAEATDTLRLLFKTLPSAPKAKPAKKPRLVVEGAIDTGTSNRPRLRFEGHRTGPARLPPRATRVDPGEVSPVTIDGLCAASDGAFVAAIRAEPNLPPEVRDGLIAALRP
jgi:hypothetical protein